MCPAEFGIRYYAFSIYRAAKPIKRAIPPQHYGWLPVKNPEWIARQLGHSTTEMLFRVYFPVRPQFNTQGWIGILIVPKFNQFAYAKNAV